MVWIWMMRWMTFIAPVFAPVPPALQRPSALALSAITVAQKRWSFPSHLQWPQSRALVQAIESRTTDACLNRSGYTFARHSRPTFSSLWSDDASRRPIAAIDCTATVHKRDGQLEGSVCEGARGELRTSRSAFNGTQRELDDAGRPLDRLRFPSFCDDGCDLREHCLSLVRRAR